MATNKKRLGRRGFVLTGLASAALALSPSFGLALTDSQARALVDSAVSDINKIIASGRSLNSMIRDFEKMLVKYGDVQIIALSALGPAARGLSGGQKSSYVKAFQGYISRKYGKRFNEFVGGTVSVTGARKVKSFIEVRTKVKLSGSAPFDVNFLVSDKSGKPRFFDILIEGVSIRLSEKGEIGAMLDRRGGDINGLIADLKKAG